MDVDAFAQNAITYLVAQNNVRDLGEAVALAVSSLKNKDGKYVRVNLSDDIEEHIFFCKQIAEKLMKGK